MERFVWMGRYMKELGDTGVGGYTIVGGDRYLASCND